MTPERVERVLADFRDWLTNLQSAEESLPPAPGPVDLHTLVGQFIALRHEVNLQTKAARSSLEQNAETLQQLEVVVDELRNPPEAEEEGPGTREELKPLFKALIDVYDALALAERQVDKQKTALAAGLESAVQAVEIEPPPEVATTAKTGFWGWLLGGERVPNGDALSEWHRKTVKVLKEREQKAREGCAYLKEVFDSLMTGYAMSLNRIDRTLTKFGLEPIQCAGERFDPEMMEVVEAVAVAGRKLGDVIEEVRRGYLLDGAVFRYAQVRVAR
jgi:molecular chaperone GrpE